MINNRQAGRRRGRGGQQQRSQGGTPGRLDTGNRIDNRARGNAAQLLEKYKTLARDAQMQGDRVNVEYYLQFADHYFRVLAETRARIEENGGPVQRRIQGATLDEDDTEFEDEGERIAPAEQQRGGQNGYRQDGRQDGRQDSRQDGRQDNGRNDGGRQDNRSDGNRVDGNRAEASRAEGRSEQRDSDRGYQRSNRPAGDQQNGASDTRSSEDQADRARNTQHDAARGESVERQREPRGEDRYARAEPRPAETQNDTRDEPAAEQLPIAMTSEQDAAVQPEASEPPRRGRGRPRRDASLVPTTTASAPETQREPASTADENSFSADLLPPSLNISATGSDEGDADVAEKPRRRRGRPPIVRETDPVA